MRDVIAVVVVAAGATSLLLFAGYKIAYNHVAKGMAEVCSCRTAKAVEMREREFCRGYAARWDNR